MSNTEKKRVLMSFYTPMLQAGVPHVIMEIVRNLHDKYTFDLLLNEVDKSQVGFYDEEFLSYGGKIYYCKKVNWFKNRIGDLANLFLTIVSTYRLCKKNRYDVIHCHDSNYSGAKLLGARLAGVKKRIAHSHIIYTKYCSRNPIKKWVKNSLLTKMTIKHSTDRLSCSTLSGESIFTNVDFMNVLNPVDLSAYLGLKKNKHQGCNLLQIGYYCSNKNQLFSIKLLKSLLDDGMNVKLTFIGFPQDKAYYDKMLEMVESLSLNDRVVYLASDADKKHIFSYTDIVLIPSFVEGLSIVALEAQSAGIPAVLSDCISEEANIGLANYAKCDSLIEWKKTIVEIFKNKKFYESINVDIKTIETKEWCNRIGKIYDK